MKSCIVALFLCGFCVMPSFGADNLFVGTWKSNPAKSQVTGRTVTYSKSARGYHFAGGQGEDLDFAMDGKEYAAADGYSSSWTPVGNAAWKSLNKVNGRLIETVTHEISSDGKTLTETYTTHLPDGKTTTGKIVRMRASDGSGLLGTWKTVEASMDPEVTIISQTSPGRLRMETPSRKEIIDGPTDGTPFEMTSPSIPKGWLATLKLTGPRRLEWTGGLKDKPEIQGVNTLSEDGKTITSTYWFVGKESEKFTEVDDRQ